MAGLQLIRIDRLVIKVQKEDGSFPSEGLKSMRDFTSSETVVVVNLGEVKL